MNALQTSLDSFYEYCTTWQLNVNVSKTKILIFGSGPATYSKTIFKFGEKSLSLVDIYICLGINLHRNKRMVTSIKTITGNATKTL